MVEISCDPAGETAVDDLTGIGLPEEVNQAIEEGNDDAEIRNRNPIFEDTSPQMHGPIHISDGTSNSLVRELDDDNLQMGLDSPNSQLRSPLYREEYPMQADQDKDLFFDGGHSEDPTYQDSEVPISLYNSFGEDYAADESLSNDSEGNAYGEKFVHVVKDSDDGLSNLDDSRHFNKWFEGDGSGDETEADDQEEQIGVPIIQGMMVRSDRWLIRCLEMQTILGTLCYLIQYKKRLG